MARPALEDMTLEQLHARYHALRGHVPRSTDKMYLRRQIRSFERLAREGQTVKRPIAVNAKPMSISMGDDQRRALLDFAQWKGESPSELIREAVAKMASSFGFDEWADAMRGKT